MAAEQGTIDAEASLPETWIDLPVRLRDSLDKVNEYCQTDEQIQSSINNNAIESHVTFGIKAVGSDNAILATVSNGHLSIRSGPSQDAAFVLCALPEQWEQFFKRTPVSPYQSYWGIRRKSRALFQAITEW